MKTNLEETQARYKDSTDSKTKEQPKFQEDNKI